MIEVVETFSFENENTATHSAPMLFTCNTTNGFAPYYVKYILHENEFDNLVYEIVCQRLADYFGIKVPEIALVNVTSDSFDPKSLVKNRVHFRPGIVAFGSKNIENNDLLSKLDSVPNKSTFNLFARPLDLIKIALFDLHVYNTDRNEENFNLLIKKTKPSEFYAIDHFHCFGGSMNIGTFHPGLRPNRDGTIIRSSFCLQMFNYLDHRAISQTITDYYYLCLADQLEAIIDDVFNFLPPSWALSANLDSRLKAFITDADRINSIQEQVIDFFRYIKP